MGGPESRTLDDEGLPRPPAVRGKIPRSVLRILVHAESVMFMAIAGGFQLQPFLVIGIISATRKSSREARNCHSSVHRRRWSAR